MNHVDLFSGIGGFALAASRVWDDYVPLAHSDIEPYPCAVYHKHFPTSKCLGDITKIDFLDNTANLSYIALPKNKQEEFDMGAQRKAYDEAINLYDRGLSIQVVADFYGVSRQAMWMILKRRGCCFRDKNKYGEDNHFYRGTHADDRSQNLLEEAIERGIVVRISRCEKCGDTGTFKDGRTAIQAHHCDYNKPLEIMWLCQSCHHKWHKEHKATPRKEGMPSEVSGTVGVELLTGGFP